MYSGTVDNASRISHFSSKIERVSPPQLRGMAKKPRWVRQHATRGSRAWVKSKKFGRRTAERSAQQVLPKAMPHSRLRGDISEDLESKLFVRGMGIGADGSIVRNGDAVFVLQPRRLAGQIEEVCGFGGVYGSFSLGVVRSTRRVYGNMMYQGRCFCVNSVINANRGPAVLAVRALQRAHRERLRIRNELVLQQDIYTIAKCSLAGEGKFVRKSLWIYDRAQPVRSFNYTPAFFFRAYGNDFQKGRFVWFE